MYMDFVFIDFLSTSGGITANLAKKFQTTLVIYILYENGLFCLQFFLLDSISFLLC